MSKRINLLTRLSKSFSTTRIVSEGLAEILTSPEQEVFYNPEQQINRDLSVLLLQVCLQNKAPEILDCFAATGIRSIRYLKELSHVAKIVINDLDPTVVPVIKRNLTHNKIPSSQTEGNHLY